MVPCVRFRPFVRFVLRLSSSRPATLGTGGWLDLSRQGLPPCKKRQACLGAHALEAGGPVCVETTGASAEILDDLLAIGRRFGLLLVRVEAPLAVCLERVVARDQTDQIPMAEDGIREVHARSAAVDLPFDIVLENVGLTDEEILRPFLGTGVGEA